MNVTIYNNILTNDQISTILYHPNIISAKSRLSHTTSSINFSIPINPNILNVLGILGVDTTIDVVPMRWIKGDTAPHKDRGTSNFNRTHLIYLSDSDGSLRIDNTDYPIKLGTGYVFAEGMSHETIGTGLEPRLLMGPFNEVGLAVGAATSISADGATDIVYFKTIGFGVEYRINDGIYQSLSLPVTINNSNTTAILKVLFENDITISSNIFHFRCGTSHIQFGSQNLNNDGSRPKFIVSIDSYDGLIYNGDDTTDGKDHIYVYNLIVDAPGRETQIGGGWIGMKGFGRGKADNYIINCASTGNMPDGAYGSGGIVGAFAGSNGGTLTLIGCSSSGAIGELCGGIVGGYAGKDGGTVSCRYCYSSGLIRNFAGGILGNEAGSNGYATAIKCYSTGNITSSAGGIFGVRAGINGEVISQDCYSIGDIGLDAGGIYGIEAGQSAGLSSAINCYSYGPITTSGNGIYGSSLINGVTTNCYSANGSWSTATASSALTGVGTTWIEVTTNQPFEIINMGYSPYITSIITGSPPSLVNTTSSTIPAGSASLPALISGQSYSILKINNASPSTVSSITIDSTSGAISTTNLTPVNTYTLLLRNEGSYHISSYELTVEAEGIPCFTEDTRVLTPCGYTSINELSKGDIVITSDGRSVPITSMLISSVYANRYTLPVIIPAHSIAPNYPPTELSISQYHLIQTPDKTWILPTTIRGIRYDTSQSVIKYYHIELPDYTTDHLVINNGVIAESFAFNIDPVILQRNNTEYHKRVIGNSIAYLPTLALRLRHSNQTRSTPKKFLANRSSML